METPLGSYEMEYLKMAILKHEKTFKEQVNELHRLYRIQKILMKGIGSSNVHAFAGNNNNNNSNENYSSSYCMDNKAVAILNYMKLQQQEMIIRPAAEDPFVEEAAAAADAIEEEERQVELTLGIGTSYSNYDNKNRNRGSTYSASSLSTCSSGSTIIRSFDNDVEAADERDIQIMKQQRQYPPWIFQVLTLNST